MGEIHELFVLALFLVWFAGATPDTTLQNPLSALRVEHGVYSPSLPSYFDGNIFVADLFPPKAQECCLSLFQKAGCWYQICLTL